MTNTNTTANLLNLVATAAPTISSCENLGGECTEPALTETISEEQT